MFPSRALTTLFTLATLTTSCHPDERVWEDCKSKHDLSACDGYPAAYPSGKYLADSAAEARRLRWERAVKANTEAALGDFLKRYPTGAFSDEAQEKLDAFVDKKILLPKRQSGKSDDDLLLAGYVDPASAVVVPPKYRYAGRFDGVLAPVHGDKGWGFVDRSGREVIAPDCEGFASAVDGLVLVKRGGRWGFVDRHGKVAIDFKFDDAWPFSDGLALVKLGGGWGYIAPDGKMVIAPDYDGAYSEEGTGWLWSDRHMMYFDRNRRAFFKQSPGWLRARSQGGGYDRGGPGAQVERMVTPDDKFRWADDFSDGLARVLVRQKYGFIDKTGKPVIEPKFDHAGPFSKGVAVVEIDGKAGWIDRQGAVTMAPQFDNASTVFSDGLLAVRSGGKIGYLDQAGKWVISAQFDFAGPFFDGLAIVTMGKKHFHIDRTGKRLESGDYDGAGECSEGLCAVSEKERWGFVDGKGQVVIPLQYGSVGRFEGGLARVTLGNDDQYIDKTGKTVVK